MGWASRAIERLNRGESVTLTPRGHSMAGKGESGETVIVEPVGTRTLAKGDIVLCTVRGRQYLHLIGAVDKARYRIDNAHGRSNGWVGRGAISGILVR